MKRWAFITVFLYGALLVILTVPLIQIGFPGEEFEIGEIYSELGYWIWIGILVLAQGLLLIVPVDLSQGRDVSRKKLLIPTFAAGFLLANVLLAGFLSICELIYGDIGMGSDNMVLFTIFVTLILWSVWSVVFWRYWRNEVSKRYFDKLIHWLLTGSILELLVAVPSHVVARNRGYCCAGFNTFWGIVTGISVMLLAFGPAVFFLFAKRFGRLKPKAENEPEAIDDKQE